MEFFEIKFDEDLIGGGVYVTYNPKTEDEIKCALKTSSSGRQVSRKMDRLQVK